MSTITAYGYYALDMGSLNFDSMPPSPGSIESITHFAIAAGKSGTFDLRGQGFGYDGAGLIWTGRVAEISLQSNGNTQWTLSGLNAAVTDLTSAAYSKNSQLFIRDVLHGNDTVNGSKTGDVLMGFGGNDVLHGNSGLDVLNGGTGNDTLIGGRDSDTLTGGAGADRFVFLTAGDSFGAGADIIKDFSHQQHDRIDLSAVDAQRAMPGEQHFTFVGKTDHVGAGEVGYSQHGGETWIIANTDGKASNELFIRLTDSDNHAIELHASDFIL